MDYRRISLSLFVLLLVAQLSAGTVRKRRAKVLTCSRQCRVPKGSKFHYVNGHVYEYAYTVRTSTFLTHSPHNVTGIVIEATAQVHVISTCDMLLKLREVRVLQAEVEQPSPPQQKARESTLIRQELEKEALRFAFLDGRISDVCPSNGDTTWAVNVKRGFLSAFQNSMDSLTKEQSIIETDVLGTCLSSYHAANSGWLSNIINKSRDLDTCYSSLEVPVTHIQRSGSLLRARLSGKLECQQTIDWKGILTSATCAETRYFRPVAGEVTAAVTSVTQSIRFVETRERGQFSPPVYKRTGLEYEQPDADQTATAKQRDDAASRTVRERLRTLCQLSDVVPETVDLFYELVGNIRQLSAPALRSTSEKVSGNALCNNGGRVQKFFIDALAMAGTEASVHHLVKTLTSENRGVKTDPPINVDLTVASLAFLPITTAAMLQSAKILLDHEASSEAAMLAVGSMVHNYCQQREACDAHIAVTWIMLHFRKIMGPQCLVHKANSDKVLLALRAVGNTGQLGGSLDEVTSCLERKDNPPDIRLAAVQAFRRASCAVSRERVFLAFEDDGESAELRIASYLTVMQCAVTSDFRRLQRALATERQEQVLSYVFTHVTNLKDTAEDFRQPDFVSLLDSVTLAATKLHRIQLSRNFAGRFVHDHLRFSSDVIWPDSPPSSSASSSSASSPPEWFPRSLTTNLTIHILGEDLDLVELGVRGQGLEMLWEDSVLPLFGRKRPETGTKKKQDNLDAVKTSLFLRVLGNEVSFKQLTGRGSFIQHLTSGKLFNLNDLISGVLAEGRTTFLQSLLLLDQEAKVVTSCGLPLTLTLSGAMTLQLQVKGKLDLRQVFDKAGSLQIDGSIRPSASFKVTQTMAIEVLGTKSALRMTALLHTNTILKGRVQMERGRLFSLDLDWPRDKMEIFAARADVIFIRNQEEYPLTFTPTSHRGLSTCTGSAVVRMLGLDLCGELRLPVSSAPDSLYNRLSRGASASLSLYKKDTMSQHKIFAQNVQTKNSSTTQLLFSTPGSETDRTLEVFFAADIEQQQLTLRLLSPWKTAEVTGSLTSLPKMKGARFSFILDRNRTFGIVAEVKVNKDTVGLTYRPVLELRHPGLAPVRLSGSLSLGQYLRQVKADAKVEGLFNTSPSFKGTITWSRKELSIKGSANIAESESPYSFALGTFMVVSKNLALKSEFTPFFYINTPSRQVISLSGRGEYRKHRLLRAEAKLTTEWTKPVTVQCGFTKTETKRATHYHLEGKLKTSFAVVALDTRADVREGLLQLTQMTLSHDIPSLLAKDSVTLTVRLGGRSDPDVLSGLVETKLQSRAHSSHNIDLKFTVDVHPASSRVKLSCSYGTKDVTKPKYVILTSTMHHKLIDWLNVSLSTTTTLEAPSEDLNLVVTASHSHGPEHLDTRASVSYAPDQQSKAVLSLRKSDRGGKLHVIGRVLLFYRNPRMVRARHREKRDSAPTRSSRGGKRKLPNVYLTLTLTEGEDEYVLKTGACLGRKKRDFTANVVVKKPISVRRVQVSATGHPYSKTYHEFDAEFSHTMHPLLAEVVEALITPDDVTGSSDVTKKLLLLASVRGAQRLVTDADPNVLVNADLDDSDNFPSFSENDDGNEPTFSENENDETAYFDTEEGNYLYYETDSSETKTVDSLNENTLDDYSSELENVESTYSETNDLDANNNLNSNKDSSPHIYPGDDDELGPMYSDFQSDSGGNYVGNVIVDVKGGIEAKSSFGDILSGGLTFGHSYDGTLHETDVILKDNDDEYSCRVTIKDHLHRWMQRTTGEAILKSPAKKVSAEWQHELGDGQARSSFSSQWGKNEKIYLDVTGRANSPNGTSSEFFCDVILQSPWAPVRDWRVTVAQDVSAGVYRSKSNVHNNGEQHLTHQLSLTHDLNLTEVSFTAFTPWSKSIRASLMSQHYVYPFTASAELLSSQSRRVQAKGSVSLESWDKMEVTLNVKTPLADVKMISASVSNNMYGDNLVSDVQAQYGISNVYSAQSILRREDCQKWRLRVLTPYTNFKVLESRYEIEGNRQNFSAEADFRIVPLLPSVEASLWWHLLDDISVGYLGQTPHNEHNHRNNSSSMGAFSASSTGLPLRDFSGKFRLDTPFTAFPYLQVAAFSEKDGRVRKSSASLEYHPFEIYSAELKTSSAENSTDFPSWTTVYMKTSHEGLDCFSAEFQIEESADSGSEARLNVSYPPDVNILAEERSDNGMVVVTGNVSVFTPYAGTEDGRLVLTFRAEEEERGLVVKINATTRDSKTISRVRITGESWNGSPASGTAGDGTASFVDRIREVGRTLKTAESVELDVYTVDLAKQRAPADPGGDVVDKIRTSLYAFFDQSPLSTLTRFQLASVAIDDVTVTSNYTAIPGEAFFDLFCAYGEQYLVQSNVTLLRERFQICGEGSDNSSVSLHQPCTSDSNTGDCIGGSLKLETKVPFPVYRRLRDIMKTKAFNESGDHTGSEHDKEDQDNARERVHRSYLEIAHAAHTESTLTELHLQTKLHDTNQVTFFFHTNDTASNVSLASHLVVAGSDIFRTELHRSSVADDGESKSSLLLSVVHYDRVAMALSYHGDEKSLTAGATVVSGDDIIVESRFSDSVSDLNVRNVTFAFHFDTSRTGKMTLTSALALNASVFPLMAFFANFSASVQNYVNFSFIRDGGRRIHILGEFGQTRIPQVVPSVKVCYDGVAHDFKTSFYVIKHLSQAKPLESSAEIKFNSIIDMRYQLGLKNALMLAPELTLTLLNKERALGHMQSLASFGWARNKTISVEVAIKHRPTIVGLSHHTDVSIITPFQGWETCRGKANHNRILAHTDNSLQAAVNNVTLLDLALSSHDPDALGPRQPLLNMFHRNALGYSSSEKLHNGSFYVRWSVTNPDSCVKLAADVRRKDDPKAGVEDRDLRVEVTRSRKTLRVKYQSHHAQNRSSGSGGVGLGVSGEVIEKGIFYIYSLSHDDLQAVNVSRRGGRLKIGTSERAIEAAGSWVATREDLHVGRHSRALEGTLLWDADGDRSRHVNVTTALTLGEGLMSADVTFAVSGAVSRTVRLKGDLTAFTGSTLWNSTMSLSYSPEPWNTLTFTAALLNTSLDSGESSVTLATTLTHPSSVLDLGFTSSVLLNASESTLEAAAWLGASRGRVLKASLRGSIDRVTGDMECIIMAPNDYQLSAEIIVPVKESYALKVVGKLEDKKRSNPKQLTLHFLLDPLQPFVLFKLQLDPDNPETALVLEAGYVNSSAIRLEAYRDHVTGSVTDAAIDLHLTGSTSLLVDLRWRPEMAVELERLSKNLSSVLGSYVRQAAAVTTLLETAKQTGTELGLRWANVSSTVRGEARSVLDSVENEWFLLVDVLLEAAQELKRTELVEQLSDSLEEPTVLVKNSVISTAAFAKVLVECMRQSAGRLYHKLITNVIQQVTILETRGVEKMREVLSYVDLYLVMVNKRLHEAANELSSVSTVDSFLAVAESYYGRMPTGMKMSRDGLIGAWLSPIADTPLFVSMATTANELYTQASCAYNSLHPGPRLRDDLLSIARSLVDIAQAEASHRFSYFRFWRQSHVTTWQPELGHIGAKVCLPFPVSSLASGPLSGLEMLTVTAKRGSRNRTTTFLGSIQNLP